MRQLLDVDRLLLQGTFYFSLGSLHKALPWRLSYSCLMFPFGWGKEIYIA